MTTSEAGATPPVGLFCTMLFAARSAESSRLKMGPRCKGEPGGVATPLATNDHRIAVTALIEAEAFTDFAPVHRMKSQA